CGRAGTDSRCAFCGVAFAPHGYTVEKVLAQTDHGRVYRARAPDGSIVALKELQFASVPGAQQIDAFEREAATLKTLHHPRIPRYVDSFPEGEGVHPRLYLAAEFRASPSRRGSAAGRLSKRSCATSPGRCSACSCTCTSSVFCIGTSSRTTSSCVPA